MIKKVLDRLRRSSKSAIPTPEPSSPRAPAPPEIDPLEVARARRKAARTQKGSPSSESRTHRTADEIDHTQRGPVAAPSRPPEPWEFAPDPSGGEPDEAFDHDPDPLWPTHPTPEPARGGTSLAVPVRPPHAPLPARRAAPGEAVDVPTQAVVPARRESGKLLPSDDNLPHMLPTIADTVLARSVNKDLIAYLGSHICRTHRILPFKIDTDTLWMASSRPPSASLEDDVKHALSFRDKDSLRPRFALGNPDLIDKLIDKYCPDGTEISPHQLTIADLAKMCGPLPDEDLTDLSFEDVNTVDGLAQHMIALGAIMNASDIVFKPEETDYFVRYSIDGAFEEPFTPIPKHYGQQIVSVIKQKDRSGNMDPFDTHTQQDGSFTARVHHDGVEIRVNCRIQTSPTAHGVESCTIRVLNDSARHLDLDKSLDPRALAILENEMLTQLGLILVVGRTGCGKTSLLHSIFARIHKRFRKQENLYAIEDPVELKTEGVTPWEISKKRKRTWYSSTKSILRAYPTRILLGECREERAAEKAVEIAMTAHQVWTTVHCDDAPSAPARMIRTLNVDPDLLASSLHMVLAQSLLARNCQFCLEVVHHKEETLRHAQLSKEEIAYVLDLQSRGDGLKRPTGCQACNDGRRGRIAIQETLRVNDEIKEIIQFNRPTLERDLRSASIRDGMRPLRRIAIGLFLQNAITLDEVLRFTPRIPGADLQMVFDLEHSVGTAPLAALLPAPDVASTIHQLPAYDPEDSNPHANRPLDTGPHARHLPPSSLHTDTTQADDEYVTDSEHLEDSSDFPHVDDAESTNSDFLFEDAEPAPPEQDEPEPDDSLVTSEFTFDRAEIERIRAEHRRASSRPASDLPDDVLEAVLDSYDAPADALPPPTDATSPSYEPPAQSLESPTGDGPPPPESTAGAQTPLASPAPYATALTSTQPEPSALPHPLGSEPSRPVRTPLVPLHSSLVPRPPLVPPPPPALQRPAGMTDVPDSSASPHPHTTTKPRF